MAPVTQLGLVVLATASVALAQRHAHARGHRHINRRQDKPVLTAPFGFSNATVVAAGPTGSAPDDQTSTRTETLTSTLTSTFTAPGEGSTGGAELPVGDQAVPSCGGTVYVTATNTVTVTASAGSPDSSTSSAVAPVAPAPSAPASSSTAAPVGQAPAPTSSTEAPAPIPSTEPAPVPTTSSEAPAYTPPTSSEAPAPSSPVAPTTRDLPTSSSAAPSAPSAPTGNSGGDSGSGVLKTKRGCLYEAGKNDCATLAADGKLSWITNWGDSNDGNTAGLTFIPQLWGKTSASGWDYTTNWVSNCKTALAAGSPAILGFNEPNIAGQANLDATVAAGVWKEFIVTPFGSSGKTLVSPGVTSEQSGPDGNKVFPGLNWLSEFAAAGAGWDATAVHMYADCTADDQVQYLKNMVVEASSRFKKDVWVTEFGCDPAKPASASAEAAFFKSAIEYLEGEASVKQYAAFKSDVLVGTMAGNTYASLDSVAP